MNKTSKYFLFALLLIVIDQVIKLWMHFVVVPQHFGDIVILKDVFEFNYVLNPGMAFGIELDDFEIVKKYLPADSGKIFLSGFRIFATFAIAIYLYSLTKKNTPSKLMWAVSAIFAGALGNVIDSTFYGKLIEGNMSKDAPYPWFHGQVIDMFYFKGLNGTWPEWIPFLGGTEHYTPVFNFADACIFCGVVVLLFFQKNFFEPEKTIVPSHEITEESHANTEIVEPKITEE